jgi:hypothetical protein
MNYEGVKATGATFQKGVYSDGPQWTFDIIGTCWDDWNRCTRNIGIRHYEDKEGVWWQVALETWCQERVRKGHLVEWLEKHKAKYTLA